VFWVEFHVDVYVGKKVSEEHTASIFKVEVHRRQTQTYSPPYKLQVSYKLQSNDFYSIIPTSGLQEVRYILVIDLLYCNYIIIMRYRREEVDFILC
jgi:hypothetical protein